MNKSENEVWKPVPSVPGVEASSRGEIKMLDYVACDENGERYIKGGIRKPFDRGNGYLAINVCYNGEWHMKSVHRLVAEAFLPNTKNLSQVNHKDCDPTNNAVSNLEWCTPQYNTAYREKYGTPAKESTKVLRKPLFAISLKTGEKSWFESRMEASRKIGVSANAISAVIKGRVQQIGGYWFTENKDKITDEKLQAIKNNMYSLGGIIAIDIKKHEPLYFESHKEAGCELGVYNTNITKVLKGHYNHTGGFWFVSADEYAVEKIKDKFGDEVARKVEQLMSEKDYN